MLKPFKGATAQLNVFQLDLGEVPGRCLRSAFGLARIALAPRRRGIASCLDRNVETFFDGRSFAHPQYIEATVKGD